MNLSMYSNDSSLPKISSKCIKKSNDNNTKNTLMNENRNNMYRNAYEHSYITKINKKVDIEVNGEKANSSSSNIQYLS